MRRDMSGKRNEQLLNAQRSFRTRKREAGDHRLQAWLSAAATQRLKTLCAQLSAGQGQVIEMAIAKLSEEHHTRYGAKK